MDINELNSYVKEGLKQKYSLDNGVLIDGELLNFKEFSIDEVGLSIRMPETFYKMDQLELTGKYTSQEKPQIVYSSDSQTTNFLFTYTEHAFSKSQLHDTLEGFRTIIKKMNPAYPFYEVNQIQKGEQEVGWFDYTSFALDMDIYNWLYITEVKGRLLVGGFNCPNEDRKMWSPVLKEIMHHLSLTDGASILIEGNRIEEKKAGQGNQAFRFV